MPVLLKKHIIAILALGGVFVATVLTGYRCPIRAFTGIPCPFCGCSRAILALLHGDFAASFAYHPLALLILPWLFVLVHKNVPRLHCNTLMTKLFLVLAPVLFMLVWGMRLAAGTII